MKPQKAKPKLLIQPDPQVQEERQFWRQTAKDLIAKSPDDLDNKAKYIMATSTITQGFCIASVAFINLHSTTKNTWSTSLCLLSLLCVAISIVSSMLALLPKSYEVNVFSSEAMKLVHSDIISRKTMWLKAAMVFFVVGVVLLVSAMCFAVVGF